ncbi:DUF4307 domain-containing protein [Saccharopolyspora sp. NPDC002376]
MTHPQIPQDRYGARAKKRPRPALRWLVFAAVFVALLGATVLGYKNLGTAPIEGKQVSFEIIDDHSIRVVVEVRRDDPQRPAECVVRSRAKSGEEIGRKEVLIHPADGVTRQETVVRTSSQPATGEVYGCTYNVPEYLSTHTRPTG